MENEKSDLTLLGRSQLHITGVKKIKSSEPEQVVLILAGSAVTITGANLNVTNANVESGDVSITGEVKALRYSNVAPKRKFSFKNLFR